MSTIFRSSYTTLSLLGQINEFHGIADLIYDLHHNTTINNKRGVYPDTAPTKPPLLGYFGIGIGGYHNLDDQTLSQPYYPLATDMDIYQPIPFRCIPLSDIGSGRPVDISELSDYRIFTPANINGTTYLQCWLKRLDFTNKHVRVTQVDPNGNESTYVLDPANLNPVPDPNLTPDVEDGTTSIVTVSVESACRIEGAEVVEVINNMYGGDLRLAKISEIGLYTGENKTDATFQDADNQPVVYTESIYTQLAAHRCTNGSEIGDPTAFIENNLIFKNGSLSIL